jgi:ABC-2 type transport system ATP-binding protein
LENRNVVEVEQLTRYFGFQKAVNSISFSIDEGEFFGLVGPNGAGKTTTIKMLNTLLPPSEGTARIFGFDINKNPKMVRSCIGYVPQALSADGDLTGYENLKIFAKLSGVPRNERTEKVEEILSLMDLKDAADKRVRYYSGGMVRRLEIGQAILTRPGVLFLDEPTIGLDPVARQTVWDMLENLRASYPLTVLLTTHYMEEAETLCGRVAIMINGHIAALGSPDELKKSTGIPEATLEDAFRFFAGEENDDGERGDYNEVKRARRIARRLG